MVEAKPEELRQWLEEAAGISKYRERRRETESRIKQTRENLSRLQDLQTELTARLEVLAKQAANAEKYKQFKEEERRLKAEVLLLRLRALDAQASAQEATIAEGEQRLEEARAAVAAAEEARAGGETAVREAGAALNAEQGLVYEAEAALARNEQNLAHAREMKNIRVRELQQLESQLAELLRRRQTEQQRQQQLTESAGAAQARLASAEEGEQDAQYNLAAAEQALADEQARWEEFSQRSQAPLMEAEGERVRVQALDRARVQIEERLRRLQGERGGLDAAPILQSVAEADAELAALDQELGQAQAQLQEADRELQALRDQRAAVEAALHESRQALQSARGRHASLETLQQAALREDDAELTGWLRNHGWAELPRLASSLQVEPGWEAAVEHVLSGLLQAPLLPDWNALRKPQPEGPKAGAMLLAAETGYAEDAGTLAAKVNGPAAVLDWLSHIKAAENAEEAVRYAGTLTPGGSVITRDGVWRGRSWLRYPRLDPAHSGVIARGLLLKQLKAQVEEHSSGVQGREAELNELRARQTQMENERRALVVKADQSRMRQARRMAERQAQAVRLEQTESRLRALGQEIDVVSAQAAQQVEELGVARERLVGLEETAQRLNSERGERNQGLVTARNALQLARNAAQAAAQQRGQAQVHLAGQNSALAALEQALRSLVEQVEAAEAQRGERRAAGEELDAPIAEQAAQVEAARGAVQEAREKLRAARERLGAVEAAQSESVRAVHVAESGRDMVREQVQALRLEFENVRARREGVEAQFAETGYGRAELAPGLDEAIIGSGATAQAWEDKLAQMGRRIDRLGAINLAAIQELEEGREREAYLAGQHADVSQALTTLEDAMRKLDNETQERFKTTFDKVNDIFKARFPQLFGGGEAYLELTGDDLLETGVRVMARPPGKRNSSIQMLSGGEKAMVAVALLLGLFQLNPAPFCLMDEVDAPMDDANVGRFCEVVREMAQNVQFIIITHNKITMELAEHLHGVTMQEPGVSRLVSVDVQQAVQLVGQSEARAEA
jgi:chromosome segregation protein